MRAASLATSGVLKGASLTRLLANVLEASTVRTIIKFFVYNIAFAFIDHHGVSIEGCIAPKLATFLTDHIKLAPLLVKDSAGHKAGHITSQNNSHDHTSSVSVILGSISDLWCVDMPNPNTSQNAQYSGFLRLDSGLCRLTVKFTGYGLAPIPTIQIIFAGS